MARPIARGVLSFGLVAIPVEIHTATKSQHVSLHLLHASCGSRLKNRYLCPVCNKVVERDQLVRGYEVAKGEYVQFTDEESSRRSRRKRTTTSSSRNSSRSKR